MKWITYQIVCNENENVLLTKRVGYSEANLTIAKKEAYSGKYTIEEDGIEEYSKEPLAIELGGTGANTAEGARDNLGLDIYKKASGEIIVVTDSDEAKPLGLAIDGKSEQNQYSGTNWFDESLIEPGTINPETGEDTSDNNFYRSGYLPIVNGSYVFSCKGLLSQDFRLFWYDANKNYLSHSEAKLNSVVESPSGVAYYRARWKKADGITEIMINSGETALPYEPYTNCQPSPNPSYPQEIRNIGVYDEASGKYAVEVKCTGKNMLPNNAINQTIKGIGFSVNENKSITANGTATGWAELVLETTLPKGDYVLSGCPSGGSTGTYLFYLPKVNGFESDIHDIGNGNTFTLEKKQKVYAYIVVTKGTTLTNVVFEPMIRPVGTDSTYEPYKETTATVYLDEPLRKGDKAYWNGEKLIVERYRDVEVFDGSEDEKWKVINTETDGLYRVYSEKYLTQAMIPISAEHTFDGLCTDYKAVSSAGTFRKTNGVAIASNGAIYVYDSDFNTSDISLWKAHLAENSLTLEYKLATPIIEEIDIDLDGLTMFYPTTVISNDCNANMEVEYVADTKLKKDIDKFLKGNIPKDILRQSDVVNDFTSESEKLPLSAKKGKEIKEDLTAQDGVPFKFGVNDKGEYGYIITDSEGADSVIPFKKGHTFKLTGVSGKGYTNYETSNECLLEVCSYGATYYDTKNYKTVYSEHYGNPREVIPTTFEITGGTVEELEYSETNMPGCVHEYDGKTYIALVVKALYKVTPTEGSMTISFFPVIGEVGMATIIEKVPL